MRGFKISNPYQSNCFLKLQEVGLILLTWMSAKICDVALKEKATRLVDEAGSTSGMCEFKEMLCKGY